MEIGTVTIVQSPTLLSMLILSHTAPAHVHLVPVSEQMQDNWEHTNTGRNGTGPAGHTWI